MRYEVQRCEPRYERGDKEKWADGRWQSHRSTQLIILKVTFLAERKKETPVASDFTQTAFGFNLIYVAGGGKGGGG